MQNFPYSPVDLSRLTAEADSLKRKRNPIDRAIYNNLWSFYFKVTTARSAVTVAERKANGTWRPASA